MRTGKKSWALGNLLFRKEALITNPLWIWQITAKKKNSQTVSLF